MKQRELNNYLEKAVSAVNKKNLPEKKKTEEKENKRFRVVQY
jgi:hypothetical protein